MPRPTHFLQPLLKRDAGPCEFHLEGGRVLAARVEAAFDSASRKRGLLGRTGLEAGHALGIAPCNGVHTFGMQFPIDVIFVARDGRVVKLRRAMPAKRLAGAFKAFATIEMAAGSIDAASLAVGDRVAVVTSSLESSASTRSDRSSS
ncbi:MAG TPA: DUF192 domain-containing protein [Vicinamibacterales bacterium]|nr:DUF192 domain-containing protein [Vicinamibacterales bacterium]